MLRPLGRPVAVKVYPVPVPPLPTIGPAVIGTPCMAVMTRQLAEGGGFTVMEQFSVPVRPPASLIVTV